MRTELLAKALGCGASVALAATLAACANPQPTDSTQAAGNVAVEETDPDTAYKDIAGVDLSTPDITIAFGDFDSMCAFINDIDDHRDGNTVIDIDGETGSSVLSHSIVESNVESGQRAGIQFEVEGFEDDDYPSDGTRIHIRGVVRTIDGEEFTVVVPSDQFELVDEGGDGDTAGA